MYIYVNKENKEITKLLRLTAPRIRSMKYDID
jgi:hypothetical protein